MTSTSDSLNKISRQNASKRLWLRAMPWIALALSATLSAYYYLYVKSGFFDDVYIYLAVARNAVDYGTWQYYPDIIDREALLASSPARILVLTIAAGISDLLGHGGRNLYDARLTLLLSGFITWLAFLPFWRQNLRRYSLIGTLLFLLSVCFDTTFEFEGGLLLLWVASLVALSLAEPRNLRMIGWLLPIGPLIRPDLALPILLFYFIQQAFHREDLKAQLKLCLVPIMVLAASWIVLCLALGVYPVPVTYWGKSAIPMMFENTTLLRELPERLGATLIPKVGLSSIGNTVAGWITLVTAFGALAFYPGTRWPALAAMLIAYMMIFHRMPATFWWYYQNIAILIIGILAGAAAPAGQIRNRKTTSATIAVITILGVLIFGRAPEQGPSLWRTSIQSRAQGYLSLSIAQTGRGTFNLPDVGEFILKNPEIGMISYYSKRPIFQWDAAGLAQPLNDPRVAHSSMRHFYPKQLGRLAETDAQQIVNKLGRPLPVLEVWALEDRNFGQARDKCHHVLLKQALCINPYIVINPTKTEKTL